MEGQKEEAPPLPSPKRPPGGPPMPLKTRFLASAISIVTGASIHRDGSVSPRVVNFLDSKASPDPTPAANTGVATSDHTIDPSRRLWARLFSPTTTPSAAPLPVIVYFHGGGFVFHSVASRPFDALCRRIAVKTPSIVISVDYRLSPQHKYPAPYDDGVDVLRWLDGPEGRRLIPEISAVFIAGDSAGGNIAHHVARRAAAERPIGRAAVAGLVAIQPFFGGEERTESEARLDRVAYESVDAFERMWRAFLPEGADRDHEAANVFGPGSRVGVGPEEWAGFPATVVVVGGWDPLQDRQTRYAEGLRGVGVEVRVVEYRNAIHGFYAFPELPEADQIVMDVGDFVRWTLEKA